VLFGFGIETTPELKQWYRERKKVVGGKKKSLVKYRCKENLRSKYYCFEKPKRRTPEVAQFAIVGGNIDKTDRSREAAERQRNRKD
jgi:hypothetical protein